MTDTADLLFELGTEELPPVALPKLSQSFTESFLQGLKDHNIEFGDVESIAAPRRLGVIIKNCQLQQPDRVIEKRGPAVKAAYDADGNPTKAAMGFASSCGTTVDNLQTLTTEKGEWLCYQVNEIGKQSADLLPAIAQDALDKLPIPKRMRWGNSDEQFIRPVHWLLFLLGETVINCNILGINSGNKSFGHRFHHPGAIEINRADEYFSLMENTAKVLSAFSERKTRIQNQVKSLASSVDGIADIDEELLDEVTSLVEWPVAIMGGFEPSFLEVPHEALILTMKKNQKYFPLFDKDGALINHFITIANLDSKNPESIRDGNERVVRPRLADAKFFWEQDAKKTLEQRLDHLKEIIFQKQLGSIYDKSSRVSELAEEIAVSLDTDPQLAKRAGLLSRCDLVTEMVYEFADMQGIMGRYQAARDGEPEEIVSAMQEIYLPRFSGDHLPSTKTGIALAIADRIDTLTGIFGIGLKPSGTKDPFALRRSALGLIRILRKHSLTLNLSELIFSAIQKHGSNITEKDTHNAVYDFVLERLKVLLTEEGFSIGLVNAVSSVKPKNLPDFDRRIEAVKIFSELEQADNLAAANKRINNILKKNKDVIPHQADAGLFENEYETNLFDALQKISLDVQPLLDDEDYKNTLIKLAELKDPVDTFFDKVMVMAEDTSIRLNRLSLLQSIRALFQQVADVSVLQDN